MKNIHSWTQKHRLETIFISTIILIAGFLRLYKIPQYMTFLGDEGRDARVVRNLIVHLDPILIGPMTSVTTEAGHMYLGPLYYYLMAPAMIISNLSPVGSAVMIALFSLATIGLIWWIGRTWFHPIVGVSAALLYAISPTVIIHSRSSWNPNIMPFFALLSIWCIYKIIKSSTKNYQLKTKYYFILLAVSLAFVLQSHYLGLLLIPTIFIFWLALLFRHSGLSQIPIGSWLRTAYQNDNPLQHKIKPYLLSTFYFLLIFLILMSPLLIFDMRHDWLNFKSISAFFTTRQTTINLKIYRGFTKLYPITEQIYHTLITSQNQLLTDVVLRLSLVIIGIYLLKNKILSIKLPLKLLITWFLIGIIGLSIYKQHIYDHYFGFLFPAPFILTGWVIWKLTNLFSLAFSISSARSTLSSPRPSLSSPRRRGSILNPAIKARKVILHYLDSRLLGNYTKKTLITQLLITIILIAPLIYCNVESSPLKSPPPQTLQHTQQISQKILQESQGQPFNLAMIAKQNYDEGYRYFLELWNANLVTIDPQNADQTIAQQLFVICENQPPFESRDMDCDPIAHPKAEIAIFGWAKIDQQWTFPWGYKLYKLVHTQFKNNDKI